MTNDEIYNKVSDVINEMLVTLEFDIRNKFQETKPEMTDGGVDLSINSITGFDILVTPHYEGGDLIKVKYDFYVQAVDEDTLQVFSLRISSTFYIYPDGHINQFHHPMDSEVLHNKDHSISELVELLVTKCELINTIQRI